MNTITDLVKNNLPLTSSMLGFMQSAYEMLQQLTAFVGGNYILSGVELVSGSYQPGYVVVNGEVMPFAGGGAQTYVRVVTTNTTVTVQDATYTKQTKKLVFGAGTGQIAWSTFRRATDLLTMIEGKANISHNHSASAIISGTISQSRLPICTESNRGLIEYTSDLEFNNGIDTDNGGDPLVAKPSQLKNKFESIQTDIDGKANNLHTHSISDVNNLQNSLDGKSNTGHGHAISDVNNLQNSLDEKLTILTSGIVNIGDITGTDQAITVNITNIETNDYMVIGNLRSFDGNWNSGNDAFWTTRNHTSTQFELLLRDVSNVEQNLVFYYKITGI